MYLPRAHLRKTLSVGAPGLLTASTILVPLPLIRSTAVSVTSWTPFQMLPMIWFDNRGNWGYCRWAFEGLKSDKKGSGFFRPGQRNVWEVGKIWKVD
ncbi:hypothetical protein FJTKL_10694 [Diaporthe vaccinii]|uniref:Uncharacterized protein n=1 Tax=Diaporthe vaccinii TaxID=105482 RepID=A0ABR4FBC8_9PEZI